MTTSINTPYQGVSLTTAKEINFRDSGWAVENSATRFSSADINNDRRISPEEFKNMSLEDRKELIDRMPPETRNQSIAGYLSDGTSGEAMAATLADLTSGSNKPGIKQETVDYAKNLLNGKISTSLEFNGGSINIQESILKNLGNKQLSEIVTRDFRTPGQPIIKALSSSVGEGPNPLTTITTDLIRSGNFAKAEQLRDAVPSDNPLRNELTQIIGKEREVDAHDINNDGQIDSGDISKMTSRQAFTLYTAMKNDPFNPIYDNLKSEENLGALLAKMTPDQKLSIYQDCLQNPGSHIYSGSEKSYNENGSTVTNVGPLSSSKNEMTTLLEAGLLTGVDPSKVAKATVKVLADPTVPEGTKDMILDNFANGTANMSTDEATKIKASLLKEINTLELNGQSAAAKTILERTIPVPGSDGVTVTVLSALKGGEENFVELINQALVRFDQDGDSTRFSLKELAQLAEAKGPNNLESLLKKCQPEDKAELFDMIRGSFDAGSKDSITSFNTILSGLNEQQLGEFEASLAPYRGDSNTEQMLELVTSAKLVKTPSINRVNLVRDNISNPQELGRLIKLGLFKNLQPPAHQTFVLKEIMNQLVILKHEGKNEKYNALVEAFSQGITSGDNKSGIPKAVVDSFLENAAALADNKNTTTFNGTVLSYYDAATEMQGLLAGFTPIDARVAVAPPPVATETLQASDGAGTDGAGTDGAGATGADATGAGTAGAGATGADATGAGTAGAGTAGAGTAGAGATGAGATGADATGADATGAGATGAGTAGAGTAGAGADVTGAGADVTGAGATAEPNTLSVKVQPWTRGGNNSSSTLSGIYNANKDWFGKNGISYAMFERTIMSNLNIKRPEELKAGAVLNFDGAFIASATEPKIHMV
ncbi:hypothetical protein NO1_1392 [Candidatus Termititenax aidoneus]|uniref:EF-hand domain-containing protein n=1 Tax=Termititenax aidoneus TaxID=2218524 RepID=A0A388TCG3_TERA1|nr:hypothetical protein NO1_1392 [Candidatus Termititenax aidoneus]